MRVNNQTSSWGGGEEEAAVGEMKGTLGKTNPVQKVKGVKKKTKQKDEM